MEISSEVLTTDVVVVGAGFAGCFAAMRARELGADVVVVEQGKSGLWGESAIGPNAWRVHHPDDDFDTAMEGTVRECEYMIDQECAEVAIRETWNRFQDLLKIGVNFRRDDKGEIQWYFKDTLYPPFMQRVAMPEPQSSYMHLLKAKKEAIRRGAKVLDRVLVTDLLTSNGKVRGAVGFHTREGHFYLLKAKTVIIATGTFSGGAGNTNLGLTGDGIAMALRAGAELRNMEFGKTEVMTFMPGGGPGFVYIFNNPQPNYIITNANGEQFLEKYEMGRRLPGRRYFGPPWRVQSMAMLQECKEGRGPCYVDFRMPDTAGRLREFYGSQFDKTLRQVALTGTTLDKIKYELGIICSGNTQGGGIRINVNGQSSLSALYAAGVASDLYGAAQYTIPSTLAGATITGYRAGQAAARYALTQPEPVVDEEQVDKLKRQTYAPLGRKQGTSWDEIHMKIMDAWLNVDLRNEARLKKAHEEFEELERDITELVAEDYHYLAKCHKIKNYLQCSQAVTDAALMRRETRLEHVREDYPLTDNKEWLRWVIIRRAGDKLHTYLENIPIERWKYKPEPAVVNRLRLKEEVSR